MSTCGPSSQPAAPVVAAPELDAGVAGRMGRPAHEEAELEVPVLAVRDQPDVVVVGTPQRVAGDRAVAHLPEALALVPGARRDVPAHEGLAVEERLPVVRRRQRAGREESERYRSQPHGPNTTRRTRRAPLADRCICAYRAPHFTRTTDTRRAGSTGVAADPRRVPTNVDGRRRRTHEVCCLDGRAGCLAAVDAGAARRRPGPAVRAHPDDDDRRQAGR